MSREAGGASAVDMTATIAEARAQWRDAGNDLLHQELWAVYVVLGELLDAGPGVDEAAYVEEFHDLVGRLIQLGDQIERRFEQQFQAWRSRIENVGEVI